MQLRFNKSHIAQVIFLFFILIVTWFVYLPGLNGGFLFDDYPNLEGMGAYGGIVDWESFKSFVLTGISGPLGRPVSLASFVLNDNTWPSDAKWFKPTNLKVHLLTGLLLIWATLLMLRLLRRDDGSVIWVALLAGAIWLLHPYMVSTTLYVIQRMAQLSALFMLAGMVGYFHGRLLLLRNDQSGYIWMTLSLCIGTVLATLSKENGILLPIVLTVVESCFPDSMQRLKLWWKVCLLWLPCLIVGAYLLQKLNLSTELMLGRRFTQLERILTQPRIICEYLYHLYVPRIEGRGLFQDGYSISKGLFSPITTFTSILGLLILFFGAFKFRKRYPLIAIGILFFFASHLLESTWLNLELYFEHRNYVASAFLFLPFAAGLIGLVKYIDVKLVVMCAFGFLAVLSFLTWQRASLWSNSDRLEIYWAASTPESARAQNRVGTLFLQMNRVDEAIRHLQDADEKFKTSSLLTINLLLVKVYAGVATEKDFNLAAERMRRQPFDAQAIKGLRNLVEKIVSYDSELKYSWYALELIDTVKNNGNYASSPMFFRLHYYLKGMIFLKIEDYDSAVINYHQAMDLYAETDAALSMVADVANAGRPEKALILLRHAKKIYEEQPVASLQRSKKVYDAEFERMEYIIGLLEAALQSSKVESESE